jgi:hypothetical protein
MTFSPKSIFQRADKYDGVRPINIYLLRLLYILMFFVLGKETWTHILTHQGPWEPMDAVAWCVWTAFATLAVLGIFRPLKMLPIVLLEIFYKVCGSCKITKVKRSRCAANFMRTLGQIYSPNLF